MNSPLCYGLSWDEDDDTKPVVEIQTSEIIDEKDESFFRNDIACALKKNGYPPNIPNWWGYFGFEKSHFLFGSLFHHTITGVGIYHVAINFNITALDAKWWMAFEGGYSKQKSLDTMKRIADSL